LIGGGGLFGSKIGICGRKRGAPCNDDAVDAVGMLLIEAA